MTKGRGLRRSKNLDRGIAVILTVLSINALLAATALSVDVGRLWVTERELQRASDVAALDAARWLNASTDSAEEYEQDVVGAAVRSAKRNGYLISADDVELGHLVGDVWSTALAGTDTWPPTAVAVTVGANEHWLFMPGGTYRQRSAVADLPVSASVMVGSDLVQVSLHNSQIVSSVLSGFLGITAPTAVAEVALISWETLLGTNVTLSELAAKASAFGVNDYVSTELAISEHLQLLADVLADKSLVEASAVVATLARLSPVDLPLNKVKISDLFTADATTDLAALETELGVLELIHHLALIGAANGHAISTANNIDIGPVATVAAEAVVVEPPQLGIGPAGTVARTAQVSVDLEITVPMVDQILGAVGSIIPPLLRGLLDPLLASIGTLQISLSLQGAESKAEIMDVACSRAGVDFADIVTTSSVTSATVSLGSQRIPLRLAQTPQPTRHYPPFGWENRTQVLGSELNLTDSVGSLIPALVASEADNLLGAVVGLLGPVLDGITAVLVGVLEPLQEQVVEPTLAALGVNIGNASVAVTGATCTGVRLVR